MKVGDLLSKEEVKDYHQQWAEFKYKNTPETPFNVHSSMPIVSKSFVYSKDPPISRARVFQKKLREFDPYFVTTKYANPFWHIQHYFMAMEQAYHAGSNMFRDNSRLVAKDTMEYMKMRMPTFWKNRHKNVSIEILLERIEGETKRFLFQEVGHITFYNDKNNKPIASMGIRSYWGKRAYIKDTDILKNGSSDEEKKKALDSLIRKIEIQNVKHTNWAVNPRENLETSKEELINELKQGRIPEEKLYDFFSLWDRDTEKHEN